VILTPKLSYLNHPPRKCKACFQRSKIIAPKNHLDELQPVLYQHLVIGGWARISRTTFFSKRLACQSSALRNICLLFQDLAGGLDLAQQLPSLHDLLVRKVTQKESLPGYMASPEGSAMNFEQKRRLSIAIGQLPGDRLSEVLRIIAEDNSMLQKARLSAAAILSLSLHMESTSKQFHLHLVPEQRCSCNVSGSAVG
jgi:hypothetical protein